MVKCTSAFCLFVSFIIPNMHFSQVECMLEFEKIYGIEDFVLGTDFKSFSCIDGLVKTREIKLDTDSYVKYSLEQEKNISNGNLTIEYLFTFQHDKLLAYEFKININSNIKIYEDLIRQSIDYRQNMDLINGEELKYWYTNKAGTSCHKYIRLVREKKSYCIKGGISKNK